MAAGSQRAGKVERGVVDLVEAVLLAGREGERFDAVVVDEKLVQLAEPAVRGHLGEAGPEPGSAVVVRLLRADVATRTVEFAIA
jgi:RNase II-type exonuclease C-terminal S1 domain